jgi:threonine dehydrogenase-like Zn-dependent dehydrogenase
VIDQPVQLDAMRLMLRGVRLVGSVGYPLDAWPDLVDRLAGGGLPVERLVGGRVPLADAVSGFERQAAGDGAVKLIVDVA